MPRRNRILMPHEDAPDEVWDHWKALYYAETGRMPDDEEEEHEMELTDLEFEMLEAAAGVYDRFLEFNRVARFSSEAERELARIRQAALKSGITKVTKEHVNP